MTNTFISGNVYAEATGAAETVDSGDTRKPAAAPMLEGVTTVHNGVVVTVAQVEAEARAKAEAEAEAAAKAAE
ncbi:hypothetical protein [Allomesorhizobium camelthorni]|uniref:Uncharacterized protein n=1 Tax=Allomesorhizobium camelthorni TaxID=475069 RepID=A0A6G4WJ49_9HYPH|nr:hypothetical protein [Mesorhizobium camelthorni]NGO54825.1 hypothetical protein [Mesorhizobium camelthorni]